MNAKTKSIVVGVTVTVVAAVALGVGLGVGLKKSKKSDGKVSEMTVKGSVSTEQQLPLKKVYVSKNDAYLVQDGTSGETIKLFKAVVDQPQSLSDYVLVPLDEWPIPLPSESKNRSSCFGGKEAKNACDVSYAGEFSNKEECDNSKCDWGYKCRLNTMCVPAAIGAYSSGVECAGKTPCGWRYKCLNNACVLAGDGTYDTFAECRAACT